MERGKIVLQPEISCAVPVKAPYSHCSTIFPQFLAMIVQFDGAGKAVTAIIAAAAATAYNPARS
jgi:hypothetical protein